MSKIDVGRNTANLESQKRMDEDSKRKQQRPIFCKAFDLFQLMQGLCGLDTALERVTSQDELDEADAGGRIWRRED